jgi:hypothetical protein
METSSQGDEEYQHFLEDLEEDPELRQNVNIYKDKRKLDAMVTVLYMNLFIFVTDEEAK